MNTASGALLSRLKTYLFPNGEMAAQEIPAVRIVQRGELRASMEAPWKPFTAEETVNTTESAFVWNATIGKGLASVQVTDAFEDGRGRIAIHKGPLTLRRVTGPEADRGELQRYLSYVSYCPPLIVNNPFLDFDAVGPGTLRITDRRYPHTTWIDQDIDDNGRPLAARAVRPMIIGSAVVPTEWSAAGREPLEWNHIRVCRYLDAAWHLPHEFFVYIRVEVVTVEISAAIPTEACSDHEKESA